MAAHPSREVVIPGPRGYPLVGVIPSLARDPFGYLVGAARDYGGLVRLRLGPATVYLVSDPAYVRHMLVDNHANYWKGPILRGVELIIGDGLFGSDGQLWQQQRRVMSPAFHRRRLTEMVGVMTEVVEAARQSAGTIGSPERRQSTYSRKWCRSTSRSSCARCSAQASTIARSESSAPRPTSSFTTPRSWSSATSSRCAYRGPATGASLPHCQSSTRSWRGSSRSAAETRPTAGTYCRCCCLPATKAPERLWATGRCVTR
nr:cytochrome P450 [Rhodococcus opacus PD630]